MAVTVIEQKRPGFDTVDSVWHSRADILRPRPIFPGLCDGIYPLPIDLRDTVWDSTDIHHYGYLPESGVTLEDLANTNTKDPILYTVHAGISMLGSTRVTLVETLEVMKRFGYEGPRKTTDFSLIAKICAYFGLYAVHEEIVRHPLDIMLRPDEFAFTCVTSQSSTRGYTSRPVLVLPSEELRRENKLHIADPLFQEDMSAGRQIHTMGLLTVGEKTIDRSFFQVHAVDNLQYGVLTHAYLSYGHILCCTR